jgi:hypothetical protein
MQQEIESLWARPIASLPTYIDLGRLCKRIDVYVVNDASSESDDQTTAAAVVPPPPSRDGAGGEDTATPLAAAAAGGGSSSEPKQPLNARS